jgi:hypothetical protein
MLIEIKFLSEVTGMYVYGRIAFFALVVFISTIVLAADDPAIQGEPRQNSQSAMKTHIDQNSINDKYIIYDAVAGQIKRLSFKELHSGLVKKGDFYVSCADFVDDKGNLYDIDLLVAEEEGDYSVYQAIVHKINGEKRDYSIEEKTSN